MKTDGKTSPKKGVRKSTTNPMYRGYVYNLKTLYTCYSTRRRGDKNKLTYQQYRDFLLGVWKDVMNEIIYNNSVCYLPNDLGAIYCYRKPGIFRRVHYRWKEIGKKIMYQNPYTGGKAYTYRWDKYYLELKNNFPIYSLKFYEKYEAAFKARWVKGGINLPKEEPTWSNT